MPVVPGAVVLQVYPGGEVTSRLSVLPVGAVVEMSPPEVTLYLPQCSVQKPVAALPPVDVCVTTADSPLIPFISLL